jgi:hypothetical protein
MDVHAEAIYASKPLPPYEEGRLYFTQSKDASVRFAIHLRPEAESLPAFVRLPEHFLGKNRRVRLLGYEQPLPVEVIDGQARVSLPRQWRERMAGQPAFVVAVDK